MSNQRQWCLPEFARSLPSRTGKKLGRFVTETNLPIQNSRCRMKSLFVNWLPAKRPRWITSNEIDTVRETAKQMQAPFNRRREEFPTLASGIHLLSHSLGPMPRGARDSIGAYCDAWQDHTNEDAWATSWWELSQLAGDRVA